MAGKKCRFCSFSLSHSLSLPLFFSFLIKKPKRVFSLLRTRKVLHERLRPQAEYPRERERQGEKQDVGEAGAARGDAPPEGPGGPARARRREGRGARRGCREDEHRVLRVFFSRTRRGKERRKKTK